MPQLGSKDSSLFRQVVRHYENKQYKKGIKTADQILRKNPNHGDTQAMKALIMSCLGQLEEAFVLGKTALRNDMKSHVCWHVFGLLYRAEKNYEEAIKAYRNALKLEPDSQPIQRDLALLQMQMRDFEGYIQSRSSMLQSRPSLRQNWTALAIAHHLAGNLTEAENVLNTYEETLKTPPPRTDIEHSEAVLYKNSIIAESGDLERALEHLDTAGTRCTDVLAVMEMRADYLFRLDRKTDAEAAYAALLERNLENSNYYDGLLKAKGIASNDHKSLKAVYDEWAEKYPRGDAPRRIPLDFLEGEDFKQAADSYLQRMLRKGVPSLFANIKVLYDSPSKRDTVQALVEGYASGEFKPEVNGSSENQKNGNATDFEASTYYFLAQHYNYYLSRDLQKALVYVEKAINLVPKSVDYYMTKARIFKHYGDSSKAAEIMEEARKLDEKDRYINSKAAKYQLRDNQNEKGLDDMSKFTRNETVGGALGDLLEMQCVWYLTEDAEAYLRQKKLGLALKRFHAVFNIFDVWQEDQFDFHSFSLRKGMIRAYIDMVRWEDHLRDHPFYTRMALGAIKTYILLHDQPDLAHGPMFANINGADGEDRKKALKKAKKEQQRLEKAEAERKDLKKASAATAKGADGETKKEDTDPTGTKLVQTKEPLKDSLKFLTPLLEYSPGNIDVQTTGFEVYIRRQKHALALKCLLAAHAIDSSNPVLHVQLLRFRLALNNLSEPLSETISEIVTKEFDQILPKSTDLRKWNESYLTSHKGSVDHVRGALSARLLLAPDTKAEAEKELISTLDLESTTLEKALAGLDTLDEWNSGSATKQAYIEKAHKKWSEASAFRST
ncbi:putative acetyltransferase catalytic subunit [Talaromyces proteolyticus]|uniref:Acetyltransferase catalytic subunit n=1 Tax=Talaromyces proteolyticus TaxID=1131652 RepID=A0AAD4KPL8_9EURO|nr:putative acetyltransferase catalytic subunit [Talaromyces proteolyticus]KAH8697552.1 putative acetyltransferase catalytic subunit [Talaromyces proteolyticus]